jgi:hypothetical protein
MHPISMDMYIRSMRRLSSLGLLARDGSLLPIGIQVHALRGMGIASAFITSRLMELNPFDVMLLTTVIKDSIQGAEISGRIEWNNTMSSFYPKYRPKKDAKVEEIIGVYKIAQSYLQALGSGEGEKWTPPVDSAKMIDKDVYPISAWKIADVTSEALEKYDPFTPRGAYYAPLLIEMEQVEQKEKYGICARALQVTSDQFRREEVFESGEIKLL